MLLLSLNQTAYIFFAIRFCQKCVCWNFRKKLFCLHLKAFKIENLKVKWSSWHLDSRIGLWILNHELWMLEAGCNFLDTGFQNLDTLEKTILRSFANLIEKIFIPIRINQFLSATITFTYVVCWSTRCCKKEVNNAVTLRVTTFDEY